MKTICILALLFTGCAEPPKEENVHYYIDERTELCFAKFSTDQEDPVSLRGEQGQPEWACIPCTEEVLNLADPLP